jgi:hypothetical protein
MLLIQKTKIMMIIQPIFMILGKKKCLSVPAIGFNPDDGIKIGIITNYKSF